MEQNYNSDEMEIDLMEIIMVLLHWAWAIILAAVVGGLITFCYSKFMITPTFESTSRIIVLNQSSDKLSYNDLTMSTQLTNDYPELITSRYVVEKVIATYELDTTYEKFVRNVAVSTANNSRIVDITVTDTDPLRAKELVDTLRDVAARRIEEIMLVDAVNVVDEGNVPIRKANPSVTKWTAIGILAGGFLAVAVVIVLYLLDDTIKSSEDIEKYLKLSTLGLIPIVETEEEHKKNSRRRHRQSAEDEYEEREARERTKKMVNVDMSDQQ